ncbi:hypothetical protein D9M70_557630 [compost metagenome]
MGLGMLLGQLENLQQVIELYVDERIHLPQRVVEIFRRRSGWQLRRRRQLRQRRGIAAPGKQAVEHYGDQQDQHHVQQHRADHVVEAQGADRRPAGYRRQGGGATGRMNAAGVVHHQDRAADRQGRSERLIRQQLLADHPDHGGKHLPAEHRPRLR